MKIYFRQPSWYCCILAVFFFAFTSAALAAEKNPPSFQGALELFQEGKYESAIKAFQQIPKDDPKATEALSYLGISYYKMNDYDAALKSLQEYAGRKPDSGSAHFFMGLSYQGKKEFGKSISSFQKAGDLDPEFKQLAMYQIGLSSIQMSDTKTAESSLQRAINLDPASDTAEDARRLLASLPAARQNSKPWQLKLGAGWEFDDNLTVEEQGNASGQEDSAAVFEFEGKYFPETLSSYSGEVYYEFYQSLYEDFSEFDLQTHTVGLAGEQEVEGWDLGLDYNYSYMFLGGDGFLQTHSISPSAGKSWRPDLYTSFSYIFSDKNFRTDADAGRNGANNSLGGDAFYFFQDNKAFFQLGYRLENENTSSSEYDYLGHIFTAAAQSPTPLETKTRLAYKYHFKDYDNITESISSEREDKKQTINLTVTRVIVENFQLKFDYQYIDSDSNLSSSEYVENIVFLGVTADF